MFETGSIYLSRLVNAAVLRDEKTASDINSALEKYCSGDWGDLCQEDKEANDRATAENERLLARYKTASGDVYIITEADRSSTVILFCEEY